MTASVKCKHYVFSGSFLNINNATFKAHHLMFHLKYEVYFDKVFLAKKNSSIKQQIYYLIELISYIGAHIYQ